MSHRWRYYKGFWRFQNIAVPQGATIDSAYLQLGWDNGSERTFKVIALASGNAPQPTDNTLADHGLETTASGAWTIPYHGEGVTINHTSPNINNIIQEVVDRGDWSSGNSIMLMMRLDETNNNSTKYRDVRFFGTGGGYDPELTITYS